MTRHNLSDEILITLTEKGTQILKMKNIILTNDFNQKTFKLWELRMLFGRKTINLSNANPVVTNDYFK